jgi:hypothetical protein
VEMLYLTGLLKWRCCLALIFPKSVANHGSAVPREGTSSNAGDLSKTVFRSNYFIRKCSTHFRNQLGSFLIFQSISYQHATRTWTKTKFFILLTWQHGTRRRINFLFLIKHFSRFGTQRFQYLSNLNNWIRI